MWQTLRAELTYSRPYLLGSIALAAGVTALVSTIFALAEGPPSGIAAGIRAAHTMLAPTIVGFIAVGVDGLRSSSRAV